MRLTTLPFGPVWCVISVEPSRRVASFPTSSIDLTTFTPPAFPRPPAWICALTTQTGPPSLFAAFTASSTLNAGSPCATGTPNFARTAFAWYSWMFIRRLRVSLAERRGDLLAGIDERSHRGDRLVEHLALRAVEFQLHDALDTFGADHHRHADIKILHAILAVEAGGAGQQALFVLQ